MKRVGLVTRTARSAVFERRLREAGFEWVKVADLADDTVLYTIVTDRVSELAGVLRASMEESTAAGAVKH